MKRKNALACLLMACLMLFSLTAWARESADTSYLHYLASRARMLKELGPYHTWTLEQKAALDASYRAAGWMGGGNRIINMMPGKEDISQEEATGIAINTLTENYDLRPEELAQWDKSHDFWELASGRSWMIAFSQPQTAPDSPYMRYVVEVESPGGKAEYHYYEQWHTPAAKEQREQPPEDILRRAREAVLDSPWARETGLDADILSVFEPSADLHSAGTLRRDFAGSQVPDDIGDEEMVWYISFRSNDPVLDEHFHVLTAAFLVKDGRQIKVENTNG